MVSETEETVTWGEPSRNLTEWEKLAVQLEMEAENEEEELILDREGGMLCRQGIERSLRVAVYDFTPFHEEVIGSILSSLNDTGLRADMYRQQFRYGFNDILDTFYPTQGGERLYRQADLMPKLQKGEYDALIMTSCDEHWIEHWSEHSFLEELPTLLDIPIICLHHEMYDFPKHRPTLLGSAINGKLTFLSLGEHVRELVNDSLEKWDEDGADIEKIVWKNTPTEVFVPVSSAYEIFTEVFSATTDPTQNPSEWGYEISPSNGHFIPLPSHSEIKPFKVHLFGGREEGVEIPAELEAHVLVWHGGSDYVNFYGQLSKMDLILPILSSDEYLRKRATAAFPAGIISRVPSLVMPHQLQSYNYLEPPAIVLHPDGTSEVEVVAAMRRGEDPWTAADDRYTGPPPEGILRSSLLDTYGRKAGSGSVDRLNDWNRYTDDVRAYNAKMLCKALLR
ncbi:hypothetical protein QFC19_006785 [Naganishia cerealis]|uniref:Uncharacterized protein n=1 Tax=Naganishia cerealis TaxID=610337 RepID=A0ACC2VE84_9TREE|nr:hypothetical protein QFC19_006785 [Naganishia cerealis]